MYENFYKCIKEPWAKNTKQKYSNTTWTIMVEPFSNMLHTAMLELLLMAAAVHHFTSGLPLFILLLIQI